MSIANLNWTHKFLPLFVAGICLIVMLWKGIALAMAEHGVRFFYEISIAACVIVPLLAALIVLKKQHAFGIGFVIANAIAIAYAGNWILMDDLLFMRFIERGMLVVIEWLIFFFILDLALIYASVSNCSRKPGSNV